MKPNAHHFAAITLCFAIVVALREVGPPPGTGSFNAVVFGFGLAIGLLAEAWERKRSGIATEFNGSQSRIGLFSLYMLLWLATTALIVYLGLPRPTSLFSCFALAGVVYLITGSLVQAIRPVTSK